MILCQYLGSSGVLPPPLAAWLPLFVFAMLAACGGTDPDVSAARDRLREVRVR